MAAAVVVPLGCSDRWILQLEVGLVLAISCLGLTVVTGWLREISLVQAGLTGTAVYVTGYAYAGGINAGWGLPLAVAAACGIVLVVGLSVLVAVVTMRLPGEYVIVLTLALQVLLEQTVFAAERLTGGLAIVSRPRPELFGLSLWSETRFFYFLLANLVVAMVFLHRLRHSRFGRAMVMVGCDREAAAVVGVSAWACRIAAFAVAGFLAGVAGALSAPLYLSPPGTLGYFAFASMAYLAIPALAGTESLTAVAVVAVAFVLIPHAAVGWGLNIFLLGGVGLLAVAFLGPRGLAGAVSALSPARRRSARTAAAG